MNKEELKTVIGSLMSDLRGNWAYDYTERMRLLIELLNERDFGRICSISAWPFKNSVFDIGLLQYRHWYPVSFQSVYLFTSLPFTTLNA